MTKRLEDGELEAAGFSTRRTLLWKVGGGAALVLVFGYFFVYEMFWSSPIYADPVARITVPSFGEPVTAPLAVEGGRRLRFVLRATRYGFSGINGVRLEAEATRGGTTVARVDCVTKRFKRNASGEVHRNASHRDECDTRLPEAVDGIRVVLVPTNPGSPLTFEGLRLDIVAD